MAKQKPKYKVEEENVRELIQDYWEMLEAEAERSVAKPKAEKRGAAA